jgi:hypothetical protein
MMQMITMVPRIPYPNIFDSPYALPRGDQTRSPYWADPRQHSTPHAHGHWPGWQVRNRKGRGGDAILFVQARCYWREMCAALASGGLTRNDE